jgi:hypothetical protein
MVWYLIPWDQCGSAVEQEFFCPCGKRRGADDTEDDLDSLICSHQRQDVEQAGGCGDVVHHREDSALDAGGEPSRMSVGPAG